MIDFFVPGKCAPAGSKKGFFNKNLGRVMIVDACEGSRPWKAQVSSFAQEAVLQQGLSEPMRGPLAVEFTFTMKRLGSHFGSGKNAGVLKATAPVYHVSRPDVLKLARGVEDALSSIIYFDDSQIAIESLRKVYGAREGVRIRVWAVSAESVGQTGEGVELFANAG